MCERVQRVVGDTGLGGGVVRGLGRVVPETASSRVLASGSEGCREVVAGSDDDVGECCVR